MWEHIKFMWLLSRGHIKILHKENNAVTFETCEINIKHKKHKKEILYY